MGLDGVCRIAEACWYRLVEISSIGFEYLGLVKIRLIWSRLVAWCSLIVSTYIMIELG